MTRQPLPVETPAVQGGFDGHLVNGMSVLVAIVTAGSFVRASELLDMSPSGVTRAIARFETRLGVRLLNRSTRSVSLTDEGRQFYERIAPLLAEIQEAAGSLVSAGAAPSGRLRLNADPFFSRLLLAPRLGEFTQRYPGIELEIVTRDLLGDIVADGFDLSVRFGPPPVSSLVARQLLTTRIVTVASPEYLRRHGRPLKPQDLADRARMCIQYRNPETGRPFRWEFHKGRKIIFVDTHGPVTLNDVGSLHALCLSGHGIAQMMLLGCEASLARGDLIDLFPDWDGEHFPLHAIYPSRQLVPAKVRALLDFIVEIGRRSDPSGGPPAS
jgi:DNA-binding transcriptional LysR family regulator